MRRIRMDQKPRRDRGDRTPVLPLDARDQDILRAKRLGRSSLKEKERI